MKEKFHFKSLSVRILGTVILGIAFVSVAVSAIVINMSKDIFVDTYGKSQERVFVQIQKDLNNYHENLMKIVSAIDSSWAFRLYLSDLEDVNNMSFQTIYQMKRDMNQALPSDIDNISVIVMGVEGKSYINRAETIIKTSDEILEEEITKRALYNPDAIQYAYISNGFTATTRDSRVLIAAKALTYLESKMPYAVVFFTMKESDVGDFYNYFVSETTDFYMLDETTKVVSSNQKDQVGINLNESWIVTNQNEGELRGVYEDAKNTLTILQTKLPYFGFNIYGVIDNEKALDNMYDIPKMVIICGGIALAVLFATFFITRQATKPLSAMSRKMSGIRKGDFSQYMEVIGTEEVQELAITYNYMLDDLKHYIEELITTQQEKRHAEIKALQMQINPHYVYNTLASIKWLIWQGDVEKSTRTIDAFIMLLRNTISNTDEFITVNQEIENLKNYVLINNTRYGDKVQVEFFVTNSCEECLLPKMILQPFIENAFFHAFPSDRKGTIQVFASSCKGDLQIQIVDDGIGMEKARLQHLTEKADKSEHFSGIGINNVDDRLKLIYGGNYGVGIVSEENEGTTVTVVLPVREAE